MAITNTQNTFVTNFNADGQASGIDLMTDERGHMYPLSKLFDGQVLGGTMEVQAPTSASMAVKVTSGYAQIKATSNHADFCYLGWMSADLTLSLAASSQSDSGYSAIIAYIDTAKQYSESATNNPALMVIAEIPGTSVRSATQISTSDITQVIGNKPYVILAQVYVPAGAQTISSANIIDARQQITLRQGVGLPAGSYATGLTPGTGSTSNNNLQISVINANAQVPSSSNSDLLVCRISQ